MAKNKIALFFVYLTQANNKNAKISGFLSVAGNKKERLVLCKGAARFKWLLHETSSINDPKIEQ